MDEEVEAIRLKSFTQLLKDGTDLAAFRPGSLGCHEALHMSNALVDDIERHLLHHPTIIVNPAFYELAWKAQAALVDLYQAIGAKHLDDSRR